MNKAFSTLAVLSFLITLPTCAAAADDQPPTSAGHIIWDRLAFEIGIGSSSMSREPVRGGTGYTLGIGARVGEGVVMLRHAHQSNKLATTMDALLVQSWLCAGFDACRYQSVDYEEYALMYRRKVSFLSVGLGAGVVKRTVDFEEFQETSPNNYTSVGVGSESTTRGALFYELMAQIPISRRQHMSIGVGVQGQYNNDYPDVSYLVTFQKGL